VSDDPELDKLAANRAEQWGIPPHKARQRLLDEAQAERERKLADQAADERHAWLDRPEEPEGTTALFAASAFAAITSIEAGLWDRYLLRIQAVIRARLATEEYGNYRARREGR
jgi:hypothetical protein